MSIAELSANIYTANHQNQNSPATRIAIVGCGPRGMYCLDSLLRKLNSFAKDARVEIVIYEPSAWLGAGNVYSPTQPAWLRMNFATRFVDAWMEDEIADPLGDTIAAATRHSLAQWLDRHHPQHADPNGYAPRALVGQYLMDCFDQVVNACPNHVSINVVAEKITDAVTQDGGWRLFFENGRRDFDEVVFATGHGGLKNGKLLASNDRNFAIPIVNDVYPVSRNLGKRAIAPKSAVAIRGFGLTWIDAALALTEGRGGHFDEVDDQLVYQHTGDEPQIVLPFCRSGRPMLAKPELGKLKRNTSKINDKLDAIWKSGSQRILDSSECNNSFTREIWPVLTQSAAEALVAISDEGKSQLELPKVHDAICGWFENCLNQDSSAEIVERTIRQSIDVAVGTLPLDEAWAMGEAWRKLYPALVARISHGGLVNKSYPADDSNWQAFATFASEMEKIAFGPPVINLRKMLALIDAKILCLDALTWKLNAAGELTDPNALDDAQSTVRVDVLVNAVIPATTYHSADSPLGKLIDRQQIEVMPGSHTIKVLDSGRPSDSHDEVVEGLAIFGRATEGCVLGNDTLSRKLHTHIERWATSVAEKCNFASTRHAPIERAF